MQAEHSEAEITLRSRIEEQRASGHPMDVPHAIGLVVALAVELADQHREGYQFFVYPSALFEGEDNHYHASAQSARPPTDPRDLACLPPELQGTQPGSFRASVYAIGAILYELITLESVGPRMQRPSDLVQGVPPELEAILTKALVADPAHRPDDLNALAQALYQVNTSHAAAPPPADTSHLDHDESFDVDVSMSLMPPPPQGSPQVVQGMPADAPLPPGVAGSPSPMAQNAPPPSSTGGAPGSSPRNQSEDLKATKARLESDPRPRYVVIKEGMDHGPFNSVELLQQIASHTFEEDDVVRDSVENTELAIRDNPDFAPFARHARMHRAEKAEKAAIQQAVTSESRSTMGKTIIGLSVVGALLAAGGVWFLTSRGARSDEIEVVEEKAANVDADVGLKVKKKKQGGGRVRGSKGGIPQLGGGMSCEAAQSTYVQEMKMGAKGQADLTAGQFQAVLGRGTYLNACGVPSNMGVNICAAIQNGRAVGVTVSTKPHNASKAACISGAVRRMSFPSHPKLDVTRTSFAPQ